MLVYLKREREKKHKVNQLKKTKNTILAAFVFLMKKFCIIIPLS